jgi:hypothetical protein
MGSRRDGGEPGPFAHERRREPEASWAEARGVYGRLFLPLCAVQRSGHTQFVVVSGGRVSMQQPGLVAITRWSSGSVRSAARTTA